MPNWCNVNIEIMGDENLLRNLDSQINAGGEPQPMNCLPRPEDIGDDWYNWSLQNWGTKWEMDVQVYDFVTDGVTTPGYGNIAIGGLTAWGPPTALLEHISRIYPGLVVICSYHEEGMDFLGTSLSYQGNTRIKDAFISDEVERDDDGMLDYDDLDAVLDTLVQELVTQQEAVGW